MKNETIDELQTVSALIQTVADAIANRFGAKDTEHLDICLVVALDMLEKCIHQLENEENVIDSR